MKPRVAVRVAVLSAFLGLAPIAAADPAPSADDMLRSLSRGPVATRGFTKPAAADARARGFVEGLRTRKITVEERTELAAIAESRPQIDLEIAFAYDSAAIEPAALPTLAALGKALSDEKLKGAIFLVAGHTDAAGAEPYNQNLSERRAEAVKSFLVRTYGLAPTSLLAVGYGEERLKRTDDPLAAENRRVQVVNVAQ